MKRVSWLALAPFLLCISGAAEAQTALTPQISGNGLTATIQLPGGIGADLSIVFEQVVGLNASALSLSVSLIDPTDASLLSRLPDPSRVAIPLAFPVLVRVEPTSTSALSFSGIYRISLHTQNLTFQTSWRLLKAPEGGPFKDITDSLEMGSTRVGGGGGTTSEFLVVTEGRLVDTVISEKFDAVQNLLTANASSMPASVLHDLQQQLSNARSLWSAGSTVAATSAVQSFSDSVKAHSGSDIPDVWRANSSLVNVAGLLRSAANTLKFSLTAKSNGAP